jgi:transcriptional regulator with XRE-family HTH domain
LLDIPRLRDYTQYRNRKEVTALKTAAREKRSATAGLQQRPPDRAQEELLAREAPVAQQTRRALGLNRKEFSRLTGYSERAIAGWEKGEPPSGPSRQRLQEIQALQEGLAAVMEPACIAPWLLTPNPAFGGLKPLEVVERGEIHRIWQMIFYLQSGVPS